jgi:hypothetical protein
MMVAQGPEILVLSRGASEPYLLPLQGQRASQQFSTRLEQQYLVDNHVFSPSIAIHAGQKSETQEQAPSALHDKAPFLIYCYF